MNLRRKAPSNSHCETCFGISSAEGARNTKIGFLKASLRLAFKKPILITDVTWNTDDESLAASVAGQPRGDCPYLKNLDFVRLRHRAQPQTSATVGILSA
jgi:hypothetical protein